MFFVNRWLLSKGFLLRNDNWLRLVCLFQIILISYHFFLFYLCWFFAMDLWLIYLLLDTVDRFLWFDNIAWFWTLFTRGSGLVWYLGFRVLVGIRMDLNFIYLGSFLWFLFGLLKKIGIFGRGKLYWRIFYWFLDFRAWV